MADASPSVASAKRCLAGAHELCNDCNPFVPYWQQGAMNSSQDGESGEHDRCRPSTDRPYRYMGGTFLIADQEMVVPVEELTLLP